MVEAAERAGSPPVGDDRSERVAELRRRLVRMPGGGGGDDVPVAASTAEPLGRGGVRGVAVPTDLEELLPGGVLPAGRVVGTSGGAGVRVGLLAAATGSGSRCAVVGSPALGLAAVIEQGGDLDRIALVPDPGSDVGAVVSVLLDGFDVVAVDPSVATVAPSRARVLAGRARASGAVLLVGPAWPGADLVLQSRPGAYTGLGSGAGRLESQTLAVRCGGQTGPPRTVRWTIGARPCVRRPEAFPSPSAAPGPAPVERAG